MMEAGKLKREFIDFFVSRDHVEIPGSSLIPQEDPSVLFTTAGMHPLVPYLLGQPHPAGPRLVDCQKCVRTGDIAEVGDDTHLTFFEMLGNWSLGDYWKSEALDMSYEFLTQRLGLDGDRLWVTIFAGDEDAPRDDEAYETWRDLGISETRISSLPKKDNWWGPAGQSGPCGPDSEIFYDMTPGLGGDENPATSPQRFWEIWNDVFMQYDKTSEGEFHKLAQKNVDTGLGLERTLAIMQGAPSLYETDLFEPVMDAVRKVARERDSMAERIIADHVRAATFIVAEGIVPGNTDQPYIARRLIRRAVRFGRKIGVQGALVVPVAEAVVGQMGAEYPNLIVARDSIVQALEKEERQFERTLGRGEREFRRAVAALEPASELKLGGEVAFHLYDTYGFPPELTAELADEEGVSVDMSAFDSLFSEHQARSRAGGAVRFAGGLAERSPETTGLHTATHLLHQGLRDVLGPHVEQRGSNITKERLRFDFSHPERMTPEQIKQTEQVVNDRIREDLLVTSREMPLDEARKIGALGLFGDRYGEMVRVYFIGGYSHEICGGPHVGHTAELGTFRIVKEESASGGVRRIKAVLTQSPAD